VNVLLIHYDDLFRDLEDQMNPAGTDRSGRCGMLGEEQRKGGESA
jgi:hypothetical protein